jgi:hypothetical protein
VNKTFFRYLLTAIFIPFGTIPVGIELLIKYIQKKKGTKADETTRTEKMAKGTD